MKVQDLTVGSQSTIVRDFKDIYPDTRKFFKEVISNLDVSEKQIPNTPFFISIKVIEGLPLFELYYAEEIAFVTVCACDQLHISPAIDYMKTIARKFQLNFKKPSESLFLYTFTANPMIPHQVTILSGEIGFYIYQRIYELYHESNK